VGSVAVVVPVLQRPANAAPLVASLRATTADAAVYAVCQCGDDPDTAAAWLDAGAEGLDSGERGSFAAKVNIGYAKTTEPWLFLCGDDVRFHPGWLGNALVVAGRTADVIGTNDLGNPRVVAGAHATHLLVRRVYVDAFGGGWDGPGVLAHEGYRHWYVDDEIVTAARQRQVWAMARSAVVEHLHPAWRKAEMDPVYALGQVHAAADRQRYLARLAVYSPGALP